MWEKVSSKLRFFFLLDSSMRVISQFTKVLGSSCQAFV